MLDLTNVEEMEGFEPLKPGKYPVCVDGAEVKDSQNGGQYIAVKFKVKEGVTGAGRVIFENFNIKNQNPKAAQIGLGRLKNLMKNAGKTTFTLQQPTDLCGLQVTATVDIKTDDYGSKNVIKAFSPVEGTTISTAPNTGGFVDPNNSIPF